MNIAGNGCTRYWEVKRQSGGFWEIRWNGKLYIDEEADPAIFASELDALGELCRIWKNG
jgi:hypothetical protein